MNVFRTPFGLLLFASFSCFSISTSVTNASEPPSTRYEFQCLITRNPSTAQILAVIAELNDNGRLWELGNSTLPWSTWPVPGWRWETTLGNGERIILAADGNLLVVIRQGRVIDFSVLDLSPRQSRNRRDTAHITVGSTRELALRAPNLFTIYYYFAGPTSEISSSRLLPRYPAPLY